MVSTSYRSVFPPRRAIGGFWGASDINRRIRPARFTVWTLGFNQFRFHHAIRVLAVLRLDGFVAFDLSEHAVVPYAFRFQVSSVTQEFNALLLLCYTGINCVVTRHTEDVQGSFHRLKLDLNQARFPESRTVFQLSSYRQIVSVLPYMKQIWLAELWAWACLFFLPA